MREPFATALTGGHHNSLGRTDEVIAAVLADPPRIDELFACLDEPDELVRMRAGDALEKVCRDRPDWLLERIEQVLGPMAAVDQPSVQWHVAQILDHLDERLTPEQHGRATARLKDQLACSTDWIVLNVSMDVLTSWARADAELATWLRPHLERLTGDPRKSVAKRAGKRLAEL
jgi:hypothetical protein